MNSRPRPAGWLGLAVCILWVGSSAAWGQASRPSPAANPHWSADGCGKCHEMRGGKALPIASESVTALCVSCHDGERASDEIHPINMKMDGRAGPNPGWPTLKGELDCVTCHDVRQECDAAAQRPDTNAAFLRQGQIPTTDPTAAADPMPFCDNCHAPEQTPKFNPHLMLAGDQHTIIEQRCQVCHGKPMDRNATARSGSASLRADQVSLCRSCHPHHRDISRAGHVLAIIRPPMLVYMRARELTGLLEAPSQDLIKQLQDEKAGPTLMVPDAQGRIVCSTCHNPHEQGTFAANCVLADRSLRLVKGHLFTPVRGQIFCRRCHNF
ncbi:MAG: cytochrome c3 family protein [Tepidisphaeraceae bacterium]